jgi:DNA polymerase I-like protein with 3'-5' exonuclease and polymerase domains
MYHFLDIETDSLDPTEIKLCIIEHKGDYSFIKTKEEMEKYISSMEKDDKIVGHNILRFDLPAIEKMWDISIPYGTIDTLVLSKLTKHNRKGGHSLANWGEILGYKKLEIDFSKCTEEELAVYCKKDVEITKEVFKRLSVFYHKNTQLYKLEDYVARSVQKQVERGTPFDRIKACALSIVLKDKCNQLENKVNRYLPVVDIPPSRLKYPPKKQFKKDGTPSEAAKKYFSTLFTVVSGKYAFVAPDGQCHTLPYSEPLETKEKIQIGQTVKIKEYLISQGWKPTLYNYTTKEGKKVKTSPKIYDENKKICPNLKKMKVTWLPDYIEYLSLRNRRNVLSSSNETGWLYHPRVKNAVPYEEKLPADADTLGANTGRFTHKVIANVPRVTSPYGKDMRSLFIPGEGRLMVGWDAAALEARMEAHFVYPYDSSYATEIISTDIHAKNAKIMDISRDHAKTVKYALTYGAQPGKLSRILNISTREATVVYNKFWAANPGLFALKQNLYDLWISNSRQCIIGIDGRTIATRSEHSLLNALFQSAGAVVMKYALVLAERYNTGLDAYPLIRYHDEEQWSSSPEEADLVGENGVKSIVDAGEYLKLNVPLAAEYKIGNNWAETH